jgi:hypothetical protein
MARKKAVKKAVVVPEVSPLIPEYPSGVDYDILSNGEAFLWKGGIWVKCEVSNEEAILLFKTRQYSKGHIEENMCEESGLIPVDIKITWSKRE